jgi:hypothetical protein
MVIKKFLKEGGKIKLTSKDGQERSYYINEIIDHDTEEILYIATVQYKSNASGNFSPLRNEYHNLDQACERLMNLIETTI